MSAVFTRVNPFVRKSYGVKASLIRAVLICQQQSVSSYLFCHMTGWKENFHFLFIVLTWLVLKYTWRKGWDIFCTYLPISAPSAIRYAHLPLKALSSQLQSSQLPECTLVHPLTLSLRVPLQYPTTPPAFHNTYQLLSIATYSLAKSLRFPGVPLFPYSAPNPLPFQITHIHRTQNHPSSDSLTLLGIFSFY